MHFFTIFLLLALSSLALANLDAQKRCRQIHHVDADTSSHYSNSRCHLKCFIHGKLLGHDLNEGRLCSGPRQPKHNCHLGRCIPSLKLGHIDVELSSASLSVAANAYASVCIYNSSAPMILPLKDRSKCTSCTTNSASYGNLPQWNSVCAGTDKFVFKSQSRLGFEVYDHRRKGRNTFLGGASLTIEQILAHGDNNKPIHLAFTAGLYAGQMKTIITWTPLN